jgi:hypothetical protein
VKLKLALKGAWITNPVEIQRFLKRIGLSCEVPEFDPAYDFSELEICQLIPGTGDGFYEEVDMPFYEEGGTDPPCLEENCDPSHWEDSADPPHWE